MQGVSLLLSKASIIVRATITVVMPKTGKGSKFYAVRRGHQTGIFQTWDEVKPLVNGYAGCQHKSFSTWEEANGWMGGTGGGTAAASQAFGNQQQAQQQTQPHAHASTQQQPASAPFAQYGFAGPSVRSAPYQRPAPSQSATTLHEALEQQQQQQEQSRQEPAMNANSRSSIAAGSLTATNGAASQVSRPVIRRKDVAIKPAEPYIVVFDGGSRGNPGPGGSGAAVIDKASGRTVAEIVLPLGHTTNNIAEYQGLIQGLQVALQMGVRKVVAYGDSELVCRQVSGRYKCKNEGLKPLLEQVQRLREQFSEFELEHVLREHNTLADGLSNEAMDMRR